MIPSMLSDPIRDARRRSVRVREFFERSRLVLERLAVEGLADSDELAGYDAAMDPGVRSAAAPPLSVPAIIDLSSSGTT